MGRRSHQSVGLSVVGKRRATSTASADGVVGFPNRSVARSGLLVKVPYKAACKAIDWPPTMGVEPLDRPLAEVGGDTAGAIGICSSPGAAWARRTGASITASRTGADDLPALLGRAPSLSASSTGLENVRATVSLACDLVPGREGSSRTGLGGTSDPRPAWGSDRRNHPRIFLV